MTPNATTHGIKDSSHSKNRSPQLTLSTTLSTSSEMQSQEDANASASHWTLRLPPRCQRRRYHSLCRFTLKYVKFQKSRQRCELASALHYRTIQPWNDASDQKSVYIRVNDAFSDTLKQIHKKTLTPSRPPTNIYTDGNKLESGEVGAAVVIYLTNNRVITKKYRLNSSCSVFQAELLALTNALNWADANLTTDATIYSDSRSSLDDIESPSSSHPLVVAIHHSLHSVSNKHKIKLVWVKAHVGVIGNEAADAAAKDASSKHCKYSYNSFPISLAKNIIRRQTWNEWGSEYADAIQGSGTRQWFQNLDAVRNFITRTDASFELTQVLTGHGFHKSYLHRFKITTDDKCPCDDATPQTIEHLFKDCPKYSSQRLKYSTLCSNKNVTPFDLTSTDADTLKCFEELAIEIVGTLKNFNA